jgi:Uma2 family endonuclease
MLTWKDIVDDPVLADLPYKIELTGEGKIIMSPHLSKHSSQQGKIARLLNEMLPDGFAMPECPVDTEDNTKVVDVAWAALAMIEQYENEPSWPVAPPICVEVVSPSNRVVTLKRKLALYFARGARECWICDGAGQMTFFNAEGELSASAICPDFPAQI